LIPAIGFRVFLSTYLYVLFDRLNKQNVSLKSRLHLF